MAENEKNALVSENYHKTEMRKLYMGYSQFKDFLECEKEALARVNGETEDKTSDALLFGGYVDAYFSDELREFTQNHPEMFNTKTGELKAAFKNAQNVIDTIERDSLLMKYLNGMHQVIMTGTISGVPFKIKVDAYHKGKAIVDQKIMRDMCPVWIEIDDGFGGTKNVKANFVEAFRYDLEGAIYQEIVHQNETDPNSPFFISENAPKLPFFLAVTTKEDAPDKAIIRIDQEYLDAALAEVAEKAPRYQAIKEGKIAPKGCGKCKTCHSEKQLTRTEVYSEFFNLKQKEEEIEY